MMRNKLSKEIGTLMKQGAKEEAMAKKAQVQSMAEELAQLEEKERSVSGRNQKIMMVIPNLTIHLFRSEKMTVKMLN